MPFPTTTSLLVTSLLILFQQTAAATKWVDPHGVDEIISYHEQTEKTKSPCEADVAFIHFQRTIKLLLNILRFDEESNTFKVKLSVDLSESDRDFLLKFTTDDKLDAYSWNRLDAILSTVIKVPIADIFSEVYISWREWFHFTVNSRETYAIIGVLVAFYIIVNVHRNQLKVGTIFKYILLFLYIVDFAHTWIWLLQEEELKKLSVHPDEVPAECNPSEMGFFRFIRFAVSGDVEKCKEYRKTQMRDEFWQVGPLKVLGTQLGNAFLTPANAVGSAFGLFFAGMVDELRWYMYFLLPIILIFILLFSCILLSFVTGTSFGFNIFHMINFNFGEKNRQSLTDAISFKHMKEILGMLHRAPIENVRLTPSPTKQRKRKDVSKIQEDQVEEIPVEKSRQKMIKGKRSDETKVFRTSIHMVPESDIKSLTKNALNEMRSEGGGDAKVTDVTDVIAVTAVNNGKESIESSMNERQEGADPVEVIDGKKANKKGNGGGGDNN